MLIYVHRSEHGSRTSNACIKLKTSDATPSSLTSAEHHFFRLPLYVPDSATTLTSVSSTITSLVLGNQREDLAFQSLFSVFGDFTVCWFTYLS